MKLKRFNEGINQLSEDTVENWTIQREQKVLKMINDIKNSNYEYLSNTEIIEWMETYTIRKSDMVDIIRMLLEQSS